jgi:hypothetical protein
VVTGVLHHGIAVFGTYVFCRTVGVSKPAALVGGITYGFSALLLGKYLDQPEFICLAWLPVLFAFTERLIVAPTLMATAGLAAVWALQILGGHSETIAQSALLLGVYAAARLTMGARRAPLQTLAAAAASIAAASLALALSAFQWVPTFQLLPHSVRAIGALSVAQQSILAVAPSWFPTGAAGRMPLALAVVGLWTWSQRGLAWFFGIAALALALLDLGPATPVFEIFRHLPTGTWFRAPVRFLNLWRSASPCSPPPALTRW